MTLIIHLPDVSALDKCYGDGLSDELLHQYHAKETEKYVEHILYVLNQCRRYEKLVGYGIKIKTY